MAIGKLIYHALAFVGGTTLVILTSICVLALWFEPDHSPWQED